MAMQSVIGSEVVREGLKVNEFGFRMEIAGVFPHFPTRYSSGSLRFQVVDNLIQIGSLSRPKC